MNALHRDGRFTVFATAFVLLLCGCSTIGQSSNSARQASFANVPSDARSQERLLTYATFLLIASDTEIPEASFQLSEHGFHAGYDATGTGLAFALDQRGYLLSAKHCVGKFMYLVGMHHGKVSVLRPKVVVDDWQCLGGEYAILRVTEKLDDVLVFGDAVQIGSSVAAVVLDRDETNSVRLAGGTLVAVRPVPNGNGMNIVETTLPLQRGDSGGPLINDKGQVVGINTAIEWALSWHGKQYKKLSCIPNIKRIRMLINEDYKR